MDLRVELDHKVILLGEVLVPPSDNAGHPESELVSDERVHYVDDPLTRQPRDVALFREMGDDILVLPGFFKDGVYGKAPIHGNVKILGVLGFDNYKNGKDADKILTLLHATHKVLEEVDGYIFRRGQVRKSVNGEELVHFVLGSELCGELGCCDALSRRMVDHDSI